MRTPVASAVLPPGRVTRSRGVDDRRRRGSTVRSTEPPVSNARIAIVVVLAAETMFFAGLIGAYLLFRYGTAVWPPADLPRLPLGVTWVNTLVLMASGVTMLGAWRAVREDDQRAFTRLLLVTALLGVVFLSVQGSEWIRLIGHGLTLSAGPYGSTFYVLIGSHAAHVVAAVLWLGLVGFWARRGEFSASHHTAVEVCAIYWFFVCALWLALFALVYH